YEIAKQLEHLQVDYLGVAFADEGVQLRKSGITSKIMVMNPEISAFSQMITYNLEPEIYSLAELKAFVEILENRDVKYYPIHIKLNTGMNRLGFKEEDLETLLAFLQKHDEVKVSSIFSHLSTSDMIEMHNFTEIQFDKFQPLTQILIMYLGYTPLLHILNTSGFFNYAQYQYDIVRVGIGLYVVENSIEEQ